MLAVIFGFSYLASAYTTSCEFSFIKPAVTARDLSYRLVHPRKELRQYIDHGDEAKVFAVARRSQIATEVWVEKVFRRMDDESGSHGAQNNARALRALKELEMNGMLAGFRVIRVDGVRGAVLKLECLEGRDLSTLYGFDLRGGPDTSALRARYNRECREVARRFARSGLGVDVIDPAGERSDTPLIISFRLPEALSLKYYGRCLSPEIEICTPNVIYTPERDEFVINDPF